MPGLLRQRLHAALWRLLEALRESGCARLLLGIADLLRARHHRRRGELYMALDAAARIRRIVRIPVLVRAARRLEAGILRRSSRDADGRLLPMARNALIDDFRRSAACRDLMRVARFETWDRTVRLGGELLLLKEPRGDELGVIVLKYTGSFGRFVHVYDAPRVLERYQIVLEPSWIGYQDPVFCLFLDPTRRVVVQAQYAPDYRAIESIGANLVPVPLAAGNWVDAEQFHPLPGTHKDYLAVLIANWAPHKRHHLVLDALARIDDASARIALVGYPWKGFTRERIEHEVRRRGLERRVDVYQRISRKEVNEVFNRSHANLLLSRKEGCSKVFYEGLAAGTPCALIADHDGIPPDHVNERTGVRAPAERLAEALLHLREQGHLCDPAGWWRENASIPVSIATIEAVLREDAAARGLPWTRGLHPKKNDPNLGYCDPGLLERLKPAYAELATLLRPEFRPPAD